MVRNPNGPLLVRVPTDDNVGQPTERYLGFVEYLLTRQHLKERNVVNTIGKYVTIAIQHLKPVTRQG